MLSPRSHRLRASVAVASLLLALGGCGDDGSRASITPSSLPQTTAPPSTAPPSTAPPSTAPPSTAPPSTSAPVPAPELQRAQGAVMTFLDALGRGDIAAAATTVGPISVQRTEAAGGLASMLRASTEGHGTWPSATDRTVTPIGLAPGLAVVVLQGTLRVEGTTERRVAAFPVRRAESANAWLVEPWAYDLSGSPPLEILTPAVDIEERATVPAGQPLELRVSAGASGTIYASYDAAPPLVRPASPNGPVTFATQSPAPTLVALVLDDGPVLAAAAFTISAATGTPAR